MTLSAFPVLDRARLARRTMGDEAIEVEVLALFCAEAERLLDQIAGASDAEIGRARLQALIGLAHGVGAARLAEVGRRTEFAAGAEKPDSPAFDAAALRSAFEEVLARIRE